MNRHICKTLAEHITSQKVSLKLSGARCVIFVGTQGYAGYDWSQALELLVKKYLNEEVPQTKAATLG